MRFYTRFFYLNYDWGMGRAAKMIVTLVLHTLIDIDSTSQRSGTPKPQV